MARPRKTRPKQPFAEFEGMLSPPHWEAARASLGEVPDTIPQEQQLASLSIPAFAAVAEELMHMAKHALEAEQPWSTTDAILATALARDLSCVVLEIDRRRGGSNRPESSPAR